MPIIVNGTEITDAQIRAEMPHHHVPTEEMAEHSAKLALIAKALFLQEADRLHITEGDEETRITALVEQELQLPEVSEADCKEFFQSNPGQFNGSDLFETSHILFVAPPGDVEARTSARARAEDVLSRIEKNGSNFSELAAQFSDCPSKEQGGSLGQIGLAQTVPEFEQALTRMQEGEISAQPVESRFGFHIIYLQGKAKGHPLEYEMVRDKIASYLRESIERQVVSKYLSNLVKQADIQGIDLMGMGTPETS